MTTPGEPTDGAGQPAQPVLPPHLDPRGPRHARPAGGPPLGTTMLPPGGKPRRPRGQRVARALSWIALSLSVLILFTAAGGYVLVKHYNGQLGRVDISGINGVQVPTKPKQAKNAVNYLLVGDDSRDGADGVGTQGSGSTFVTGQRSDTIILAHLYASSDKVQMVSFPRDSRVEIPRYTDPKTGVVTPAHLDKINSAFSEGGPSLLIATVEQLSNIKIDHFLSVDFVGFKRMTDALGGVNVCITKAQDDRYSGLDLPAGTSHISGETALAFVRQRHGLPNGDIDRIARQQQFIGALTHKVLSAGTLLNPIKLNNFLNAATKSITADRTFSSGDLRTLALRLRGFSSGNVIFTSVPVANIGLYVNGVSYVELDQAAMETEFAALRNDVAPGTAAKVTGPVLTVAPSAVRVSVYNGSGTTGLGRTAATDLHNVGFDVIGTAQTAGTGLATTTISYGPNRADSAKTLAAAIPGSVLQADSSLGRTLKVVIGTNYTGSVRVTVKPVAKPTTTPSTDLAPGRTAADSSCTA